MAGSLQMTFTGLLLLGLCRGVPAIVDFTCVTKPRIDTDSEGTFIAGYYVNGSGSVSFVRTTYTYSSGSYRGETNPSPGPLPNNHRMIQSELPQGGGQVGIMWMPATGKLTRIGAFACQVTTSDGGDLSIGTVIMSKAECTSPIKTVTTDLHLADFLPTRVSRTVNRGEVVSLTIIATDDSRVEPRWRKDGRHPPIKRWENRLYFNVFNANQIDGGIYEVHQAEARPQGKQALMRLIVRRCTQYKWDPESCNKDCPVCLNGGVCDDKSGVCICPPGFNGSFCEIFLGPNRFGQKGSLRCDAPELGDVPTCEGKLFCLPDPYGCSCATGYKGIDCDEICEAGWYGADCRQTCHCKDMASCNITTGVCPEDCAPGFKGVNCQDKCLPLNGSHSCHTTCTSSLAPSAKPKNIHYLQSAVQRTESIVISLEPVSCPHGGDIMNYVYKFRKKQQMNKAWKSEQVQIDEGANFLINDLSACAKYKLKVAAKTSKGTGPYMEYSFSTANKVPDPVTDPQVVSRTADEVHLSWTPAESSQGRSCKPADDYLVIVELISLDQCKEGSRSGYLQTTANTTIAISGLEAHSTYILQVVPRNVAGNGSAVALNVTTLESAPSAAPVVDHILSSNNTIKFVWLQIPCGKRGGNIVGYTYELRSAADLLETTNTTEESAVFDGLSPMTTYTFRLRAYTRAGLGPWRPVNVTTAGGNGAGAAVGVLLFLLVAVAIVLLIVAFIRRRRRQREILQRTERKDYPTETVYASAVEAQNLPSASGFEPPVDSTTPTPTDYSTKASTSVRTETSTQPSTNTLSAVAKIAHSSTSANELSTPKTSTKCSTAPPASSEAPTRPKPYKPKQKESTKNQQAFSQTGPVAMAHLAEYIKSRKSGKINGFQQDYESLSSEPIRPWTVGNMNHNKKKNRYKNILAYDHSRVVLECTEDSELDYINACYINGYEHDSRYIACQAPNKVTVNDMWRMVWQERVGKIIMLTNLVENNKEKCEQYWPDEGVAEYDELIVKTKDETLCGNFVVRTFHISKNNAPESVYREVMQFQYTKWSDMSLPESSHLLAFIRRVQASEPSQHGPIVVHCSAGVGRTGTFIALDAMLEQAQAEGQVNVLSFVRDMREQRHLMVQTLDQYAFIFETLLESSLLEATAIPAERYHQDYTKLKNPDKKTGTNGIEVQFKMLQAFTASSNDDEGMRGLELANIDKNRFKDCIPRDSSRPYLMTEGDEGSTNYINATFLDGYRNRNAYLATQAPLPNTVGDIWRMVFDYKSTCIVMLNSMDDDPSVAKYWPEEDSMRSGPLTVQLRREERRSNNLIIRQFGLFYPLRKGAQCAICHVTNGALHSSILLCKIHEDIFTAMSTHEYSEEAQSVYHIQYLGWPTGKDVPDSPSSLLELLEAVRTWIGDHPEGPLTVHCIDGVSCSGVVCVLTTLLEQLKEEKVIDVFHAVKKLRTIRSGMVNSLAQYQFCYEVIQTHLCSSSIYENF